MLRTPVKPVVTEPEQQLPVAPKRSFAEEYFPFLSSQFNFKNPIPAIKRNYEEGGIGQAIGGLLKEGYEGAKGAMTIPGDTMEGLKRGLSITPAAPAAPAVPEVPPVPPGVPRVATYRDDLGANTSTVIRPEGSATMQIGTGKLPLKNTGQVFVGAPTDAAAARNLQSAQEQAQATATTVNNINSQIAALRDLRAARNEGRAFGDMVSFGTPGGGYGDEILDRDRANRGMAAAANTFGRGARAAAMEAAAPAVVQAMQPRGPRMLSSDQGMDQVEMQRFLLDREKLARQQAVDQARLSLDERALQNSIAGTELNKQRYADTQRKDFLENFSFPDKNAPSEQLGPLVLQLSEASGGTVPPEAMTQYLQKAAAEAGVDWKNAPPASLKALGDRAMALAVKDYRK